MHSRSEKVRETECTVLTAFPAYPYVPDTRLVFSCIVLSSRHSFSTALLRLRPEGRVLSVRRASKKCRTTLSELTRKQYLMLKRSLPAQEKKSGIRRSRLQREKDWDVVLAMFSGRDSFDSDCRLQVSWSHHRVPVMPDSLIFDEQIPTTSDLKLLLRPEVRPHREFAIANITSYVCRQGSHVATLISNKSRY